MKYYLAPLEGITTNIYRSLYHKYFKPMDKYFTPFLVPHTKRGFNSREQREVSPEFNKEMYLVPQIMTNNAADFLTTADKLKTYGYSEVNLNFGCPSKTVVGKGRGSGFLKTPDKIDDFLYEIFSACDMDISIKTRIGASESSEFEELLSIYSKYPLKELIVHPRTGQDFYKGDVRIDSYKYALSNTSLPLCYNGDITSSDDIKTIENISNKTEAIMIGRGIIANPCLLMGKDTIDFERIKDFITELLYEYGNLGAGDKQTLFKLKEIFSYMQVLFPDSKKIIKKINKSEKIHIYQAAVNELFSF